MNKNKKILPSLAELEKVGREIKQIRNKKGEYLRGIHYGCFLLCSESGLRISEAVKFDLNAKTRKGLYRINKCKGNKTRYVYVSKEVIRELKANKWQPNQTNRFSFVHYLQRVKKELNIAANIELTPHTLRRCFATYQANSGMPLPVLQKVLGHSSIRTTALYWKDSEDPREKVISDQWLTGKIPKEPPKTIENKPQEPPKLPVKENNWKINLFIQNNPANSQQKFLTTENQALKEKVCF